eukprot:5163808-Amphidinium_carterae.1
MYILDFDGCSNWLLPLHQLAGARAPAGAEENRRGRSRSSLSCLPERRQLVQTELNCRSVAKLQAARIVMIAECRDQKVKPLLKAKPKTIFSCWMHDL